MDVTFDNVTVNENLYINGTCTTVNAVTVEKLDVVEISNLEQLLEKSVFYKKLTDRLTRIEEKLEALWYAPNMPGYFETLEEFESLRKTSGY